MDDRIYTTADFNLACYLFARWLLFTSFEKTENIQKWKFVFTVPQDINLIEVLKSREAPESQLVKDVLYKAKLLKAELRNQYNGA
jgi:hypothetical protein